MIEAVTLDFGNTLVPVASEALRGVVRITAEALARDLGGLDPEVVMRLWSEERERQFREEVPEGREVDLAQRVVRILARLRGMAAPGPAERWDDAGAARLADPDEVDAVVMTYSNAFVASLPPAPGAGRVIAALATNHRVAILSNWPLSVTIDRYCEAAGWMPDLAAVVVSQRVGAIKPYPAIFAAARAALGDPPAHAILHVGDDWTADVVGAKRVGWLAAWLAERPSDSPLPGSERDGSVEADLVLGSLEELPAGVERLDRHG